MNPALQALLERHIANNFADFEGLTITGTIPVRDTLLNELLAEFLHGGFGPVAGETATTGAQSSAGVGAMVDTDALLRLVRQATIRTEAGRIVLDFEIGR